MKGVPNEHDEDDHKKRTANHELPHGSWRPNGQRISGERRAEGDERVRCMRVLGAGPDASLSVLRLRIWLPLAMAKFRTTMIGRSARPFVAPKGPTRVGV